MGIFLTVPVYDLYANKALKSITHPKSTIFSGVWERFIRQRKDALCSVVRCQTLTDETFSTVLCEIENLMTDHKSVGGHRSPYREPFSCGETP